MASKKTPTPAAATNNPGSQILDQLAAADLDSQATQQFNTMAMIRQARVSQMQRQIVPLTAQLGASDPVVVSLQTSISTQSFLSANLAMVRDQISTPTPTVPTKGWIVQGRVRDQSLQPVANATVMLADAQKAWIREFGYAFTDTTGYFILTYTSPVGESKSREDTPSSVYLEVLNQKRQPVYIDSSPFTPTIGVAQYRDVVLSSQTPLGVAPPGAPVQPPAKR